MIDTKTDRGYGYGLSGFDPIRVILEDLRKTGDVVRKIGERNAGFGPDNSDTSEYQPAHRALDKSEDVFDPASDFDLLLLDAFCPSVSGWLR